MSGSLRKILDTFPNHRVLVLGDVMVDEYLVGDCSRLSPEAPVPVLAVTEVRSFLGGAANTANNIAALGGQAVLVGVIGGDDAGTRVVEIARAAGIDFRPVVDERATVRKVRVVGHQQQLLRLDYESPDGASSNAGDALLATTLNELPFCDVIVISDYAKGCLSAPLCQAVIARARELGKPVVVDPRPHHAEFYVGCDFITPNWKESRGLLGLPEVPMSAAVVAETGRLISERFRSHALLTLGPKGMTLFARDGELLVEQRALAREVFDVSGAGDTVVASFALALAAGCPVRDAVDLANRAAGIVVAKLGTATVTPSELLRDASPERALVRRGELRALSQQLKSQGRRIVTVYGSFDILQAGHLDYLRAAREQGDTLIAGIMGDEAARASRQFDGPFMAAEDRARLLLALRDVDYVHIVDDPSPVAFLETVGPDVHVQDAGPDTNGSVARIVRAGGGRVHEVEMQAQGSTADLVRRIRSSARVS